MAGMKHILDRVPRPPGAIPARAQTWLLVGLTAVMAVVFVTFPGQADGPGRPPATEPVQGGSGPASGVGVAAVDGAADRIREESIRRAEQRMRVELGVPEPRPDGLPHAPGRVPAMTGSHSTAVAAGGPDTAVQIEQEERMRRYRSLRVPPLVQSVRTEGRHGSVEADGSVPRPGADTPTEAETPVAGPVDPQEPPAAIESSVVPEPQQAPAPMYILREGEFLEAVLTNRLAGDFVGPVNAMVAAAVHDRSRQRVLIPRGTRALGQASPVQDWGQSRLAVTFHRLVLPDGSALDLADGIGLNQIGETGLRDRVNRHYLSTLAAAGAVGALAGLSQSAGPEAAFASRLGSARLAVGTGLSRATERMLERYLNRLPQVTIREGHRIRIHLTRDLTLPAYAGVGDPERGDTP